MALNPTSSRPSGGGSLPVQSASVTVNNAQIKALPSSARTIVTAPGANKTIVPFAAYLTGAFAVDYGGIDANTDYPMINIALDPATTVGLISPIIDDPDGPQTLLTAFLTPGNPSRFFWSAFAQERVKNDGGSYVGFGNNPQPLADWENTALLLASTNSGNFTGGDATNTLTVTVLYTVLDT